ncbi:MAG: Gfo/Idh/MocA family oxidoreductase [Bacteroidetes bacterium]|nr:Gfo/Idh/MocA family oxidoreductase [Bacteroidota bacterium]
MKKNMNKVRFALIGAAGFIAPRHMKAIKETGNDLIVMLDPCDSVGVIDSYFPDADFFTEPERFDRHIDKLRRQGEKKIDYISICSPNYLHDAHIRLTLRNDAHAICEKPLVLNPWNVDALDEIEKETGKKINVILQLRLHPVIQELKKKISESSQNKIYDIDLTYITSRGRWYFYSWKGDIIKSGGVATNIGVHFFDVLTSIFGDVEQSTVHFSDQKTVAGFLYLKNARIRWLLSLDFELLPDEIKARGQQTYRSLTLDGKEIEFSEGFTDLHTVSYKKILEGDGFTVHDARPGIRIAYEIRNALPSGLKGDYHPFLQKIMRK